MTLPQKSFALCSVSGKHTVFDCDISRYKSNIFTVLVSYAVVIFLLFCFASYT